MNFETWQKLHESFLGMKSPDFVLHKDKPHPHDLDNMNMGDDGDDDGTGDDGDEGMGDDDDLNGMEDIDGMEDDPAQDDMNDDGMDDNDMDSGDDVGDMGDAGSDDADDADADPNADPDNDDMGDDSMGDDGMGNDLNNRIKDSNMKHKKQQDQSWMNSFEEYVPFKEPARLGTDEYAKDFEQSLVRMNGKPGERFSDGMAAREDVLFSPPTPEQNMPVVQQEEQMPERWDASWSGYNWEEQLKESIDHKPKKKKR